MLTVGVLKRSTHFRNELYAFIYLFSHRSRSRSPGGGGSRGESRGFSKGRGGRDGREF